jgi:hypothetical protein
MVSGVRFASTNLKLIHKHFCRIKVFLMLSTQFIVVHTITELHEKYFHENILFGHNFVSGYSSTDSTYWVHYCFLSWTVEYARASLRTSKDTIAKLNNSSYGYHHLCASTVTVAEFLRMAGLTVINVGSVYWFLSERYNLVFYRNCGQYLVNVNIVFILKSLYSQFPIFNRSEVTCSWKLLEVVVLKHSTYQTQHTIIYDRHF